MINAITHRDYSIEGRGIEIRIYDDRLEILSPGKLLTSLTIKDLEELKGVHQTRNTYIGRTLREFGYVRELGEGIRRMYELMKSNELIPPKIESPNKSFIVSLFYKHIYSKEEKLWLDSFENFNLSREQKTVVRLGMDGKLISPKQIIESVGVVDIEDYRQLVHSLQILKILDSEIPKNKAQSLAKSKGVSIKAIPRFKIMYPETQLQNNPRIIKNIDTSDYAKIYVGNLDYSITEDSLSNFFSKYGVVTDVKIPRDRHSGKSKGFAFVEFESLETVQKILNDTKNEIIIENGRKIYIQEYKKY